MSFLLNLVPVVDSSCCRGAFSTVYRCKSKADGKHYAVKVIMVNNMRAAGACVLLLFIGLATITSSPDKLKIEREAEICQMVHHDNIGT